MHAAFTRGSTMAAKMGWSFYVFVFYLSLLYLRDGTYMKQMTARRMTALQAQRDAAAKAKAAETPAGVPAGDFAGEPPARGKPPKEAFADDEDFEDSMEEENTSEAKPSTKIKPVRKAPVVKQASGSSPPGKTVKIEQNSQEAATPK